MELFYSCYKETGILPSAWLKWLGRVEGSCWGKTVQLLGKLVMSSEAEHMYALQPARPLLGTSLTEMHGQFAKSVWEFLQVHTSEQPKDRTDLGTTVCTHGSHTAQRREGTNHDKVQPPPRKCQMRPYVWVSYVWLHYTQDLENEANPQWHEDQQLPGPRVGRGGSTGGLCVALASRCTKLSTLIEFQTLNANRCFVHKLYLNKVN